MNFDAAILYCSVCGCTGWHWAGCQDPDRTDWIDNAYMDLCTELDMANALLNTRGYC